MLSAGYFRNFNENNIETSVEVYYKKMNHVLILRITLNYYSMIN